MPVWYIGNDPHPRYGENLFQPTQKFSQINSAEFASSLLCKMDGTEGKQWERKAGQNLVGVTRCDASESGGIRVKGSLRLTTAQTEKKTLLSESWSTLEQRAFCCVANRLWRAMKHQSFVETSWFKSCIPCVKDRKEKSSRKFLVIQEDKTRNGSEWVVEGRGKSSQSNLRHRIWQDRPRVITLQKKFRTTEWPEARQKETSCGKDD